MKLHLFQELIELNQAFDHVLRGLQRMEKTRFFQDELIRYARAEVEGARVDANREFFDKFDRIVEDDARWAYHFQREYDRKSAGRRRSLPRNQRTGGNPKEKGPAAPHEDATQLGPARRRATTTKPGPRGVPRNGDEKVTEKRRNPSSAESPRVVQSNAGDTASGESKP